MRKLVLTLLLVLSSMISSPLYAAPERKVLLVVSGHGQDAGRTRPGFEFDEFAQAYLVFRENGLGVDLASPQGGRVEADDYDPKKPYNARVLADPGAVAMLAATRAMSDVKAADYAAIFVIGGKGAMFDLPANGALQSLLADVHRAGGIVAAVCHGPAALVDVRRADGSRLIAGKAVTGFTNEEEAMFGKRWAKDYPFLLEDALRAGGGRYAGAAMMLPFVQSDDRIVTGQNPYSTALAAEATLRAMGITPTPRIAWADERSLLLVSDAMKGKMDWARTELAANTAQYDIPLIAMYGVYRAGAAGAGTDIVADALAVMTLAEPHFAHTRLQLAMAEAEKRLGRPREARARVEKILAQTPDMKEARALLTALEE
jgi:putative intracellular protease/amidase